MINVFAVSGPNDRWAHRNVVYLLAQVVVELEKLIFACNCEQFD